VSTADGKGREAKTTQPLPPPARANRVPTPPNTVLGPDEAVTVIVRWKLNYATITPVSHGAPEAQEEQKTPEFSSCALAENRTVFSSTFQLLCRSSAQTTGLKRERVSSKILLLLPLRSTWLSLRSSWKPHSRSFPPGGQETISQGSYSIVQLQTPSENIPKTHTPPLSAYCYEFFSLLNRDLSTNRKF